MTTFKINGLTRAQKQERGREMLQASVAAMKAYFRGDGSLKRITRFLVVFLLYFIFWTVVATSVVFTVLLVSDALFIAPGYTYLFDHIDVLAGLSPVFQLGIWLGVLVALFMALDPIVGPAKSIVMKKWKGDV